MERLKNTPLPAQFRVFPNLFTHLFCVLLPIGLVESLGPATPLGSTVAGIMFLAVLAIGDHLVDPLPTPSTTFRSKRCAARSRSTCCRALAKRPRPVTPDADGVLW
jgi:putative membrane protein